MIDVYVKGVGSLPNDPRNFNERSQRRLHPMDHEPVCQDRKPVFPSDAASQAGKTLNEYLETPHSMMIFHENLLSISSFKQITPSADE
jgi:hypothetical protein